MILDKTYSGQVTALKFTSKAIKTPEDEKIQKKVAVLKTVFEYTDGDLSRFVESDIANNRFYNKCVWNEERTGTYTLDINTIEIPVRVINIERTNKEDVSKFTLTFETEELVNLSTVGLMMKDKENPPQIKLSLLEE